MWSAIASLNYKNIEILAKTNTIQTTMLLNEFLATKSRIKNIVITQFQTFSHRFPFVTVYSHCFTQPTKRSPIRECFFPKKLNDLCSILLLRKETWRNNVRNIKWMWSTCSNFLKLGSIVLIAGDQTINRLITIILFFSFIENSKKYVKLINDEKNEN